MKLTKTQRDFIKMMLDLYGKTGRAIKCKEIAESINRSPGTLRNQTQILKGLKLIKSLPGPKGGYIPTGLAYEKLAFSQETKRIPVYHNNRLRNVTLQEIQLRPPNNSILHDVGGKVVGRDDLNNSLLSSIEIAYKNPRKTLRPHKYKKKYTIPSKEERIKIWKKLGL